MVLTLLRAGPAPDPGAPGLVSSGVLPLTSAVFSASLIAMASYSDQMGWDSVQLADLAAKGLVSPGVLLLLRLLRFGVVSGVCTILFMSQEGKVLDPEPPRGMKYRITGLSRFTTFTLWSWTMQAVYFLCASCCSAAHALPGLLGTAPSAVSSLLVPATWVLYEVCLSTSILITVVVTFVLFPAAQKAGSEHLLLIWDAVTMHNANIVFMVGELLLTGLPLHPLHFIFAVLYGCTYVVFSWVWFHQTDVYYYFFLDHRKRLAVVMQLGLLAALALFYMLGWMVSVLSTSYPSWLVCPVTSIVTWSVMKWR